MTPKRIYFNRFNGQKMPDKSKLVTRPSRWGNPAEIGEHYKPWGRVIGDNAEACKAYREHLAANPELAEAAKRELRGFNLACNCPEGEMNCHGQILLEISNSPPKDARAILNSQGREALAAAVLDFVPIADTEAEADPGEAPKKSLLLRGVNHYPTEIPPETILLGNGWMRRGDVITFISTAGAGKSVAVTQAAMAWGLGLPYAGIAPRRPLKILLFSGEDDGVTIGQCREGFLEHSEAITGRQLTAKDLEPLDRMLRTDFSRENVGLRFHEHLAKLLTEEAADIVIINPLLSYIGGEVVACVSEWLRAGLNPVLLAHDCGALLAHHTPKLAKDGWENTDDTYSGIGGAEVANIPRSVLTLRPTPAQGLSVLSVSKRQTTGWKDDEGDYCPRLFLQRTDNPERPAWLPIGTELAGDMIAEAKPAREDKGGASRKVQPGDVAEIVRHKPTTQQDVIARLCNLRSCGKRTAREAITEAMLADVESFDERNPKGGKPIKWLRMKPEHPQLAI